MSLKVTKVVSENSVKFSNTQIPSHDQGLLTWDPLEPLEGNLYRTSIRGVSSSGNPIEATEIDIKVKGKINPTKIFFAVVKLIKKVLCPECM